MIEQQKGKPLHNKEIIMAHLFDVNTEGIAHFATTKRNLQKVWWKGNKIFNESLVLDDGALVEDMLKAAGLFDHKVIKSSLIADYSKEIQRLIGLGESLQKWDAKKLRALVKKIQANVDLVETHELVHREGDRKHLSVMGKGYTPTQILDTFQVLDTLVIDGSIQLETIGALREGKSYFMAAKIEGDPLEIVPGDVMERYLIARDSYDGSTFREYAAAGILPVCANTERAAFGEAKRSGRLCRQKHTKNINSDERTDEVRKALGFAVEAIGDMAERRRAMSKIDMSEGQADKFFQKLVFGDKPVPAVIDEQTTSGQKRRAIFELNYLLRNGNGQELKGRKDTVYGAHCAVTEWVGSVKKHKGGYEEERAPFVLFDNGAQIIDRSEQLLSSQYQLAA
jgi:phage/plasmid-like protein (TIGR03299 family)